MKDKYEKRILGQLRELGASCDWARTRFTLDPVCAKAVRETANPHVPGRVHLRQAAGERDAALQTTWPTTRRTPRTPGRVLDVPEYEVVGQPGTFVSFSTTRPETMLGDTALCVHPDDERYKPLIGQKVRQPLVNQDIPIIADGLLADPSLGTGCCR
ncbi:MAG: class I tRNA ligase family protein [Gemmataceae bacterium]